jgi:3-oxoacyl-[acyl-carrier-protein] synthase III
LLPGRPLWEFLRDQSVTCVTLPPSILAMLPAEPLPALRTLVVAGEACSQELVRTWQPGRRFINAYGPTEVTVCATLGECSSTRSGPPTIGKPIANTRVYVLDSNLEPVPVGVSGELYVAGPGLALGYCNRPDLTAERFLPNPFDQTYDGMMYRTGDVVRWTDDGELEFLGRVDQQVKIRGCRIELEEIQAVLRRHPEVQDAVAVVRQDRDETPDLVAYVIPRAGGNFALPSVRAFLREHLPHYMLPAALVVLEAFPRGPTGKVDRARLPPPSASESAGAAEMSQVNCTPGTPLERLLAQIWSRVLMVDQVGPHDNFFELGGASTQTLEVVDLARAQGLTIAPDMLFRYQTVAELAAYLEAANRQDDKVTEQPRTAAAADKVTDVAPARGQLVPRCQSAAVEPRPCSPGSVVESLGAYLPEKAVTTAELLQGSRTKIDFPLERLTGIRSRRVAGDQEFSIDLALKAVAECLRRSAHEPAAIELVISCNISRIDGPEFQVSLEPASAARICRHFGMVNAVALDLTNACAGTFTAAMIVDTFIRHGLINRGMIVSGEFITHLSRTALQEINSFMDSRLACLTLGDSGVAFILERAPHAAVGFQEIELFTLGKYHDLCVAKLSGAAGRGPIMHTDAVTGTTVTIKQAVGHAVEVLRRHRWDLDKLDALIIHQTSETTLDGAVREINRAVGKAICHRGNTIFNVAERGNTATNTHFLAVWERILAGDFKAGDRTVFAVSGSGQGVGTALYIFDDLPERLRRPPERNGHGSRAKDAPPAATSKEKAAPGETSLRYFRCERRVHIESISTLDRSADRRGTVAMVCQAGEACLQSSTRLRDTIDLVLHTGVHRSEFISEPAIAAIAAGHLAINHDENRGSGRRTLAFDVLNGAAGTLTACFLASGLMAARKFTRALILASEVDLNREYRAEQPLGLEETASAMVLEESGTTSGFAAFAFRAFPEHFDAVRSCTAVRAGKPAVIRQCAPGLEDILLECIGRTVREFLARADLAPADLSLVVPPQCPGNLGRRLPAVLGVPPERLLTLGATLDYYTSSLAYAFSGLRRQGVVSPGMPILLIEVAPGLQVGCALYHA